VLILFPTVVFQHLSKTNKRVGCFVCLYDPCGPPLTPM